MNDGFEKAITVDPNWNSLAALMRLAGYRGVLGFKTLTLTVAEDAPNPVYVYHHTSAETAPAGGVDGVPINPGESYTYPNGTSGALKWLYADGSADVYVIAQTN